VLKLNGGVNTVAYRYDPGDSGNINIDLIRVEPLAAGSIAEVATVKPLVETAPPPEAVPVESPIATTIPIPSQAVTTPVPAQTPQPDPQVDVVTPPSLPTPPTPAPYQGPMAGTLTYSGPRVVQNGEIVFRNLPPFPLRLTYDEETWEARLTPGEGNTQRLILRNKKPGTQNRCVVTWRVIQ
jgi:hypothetical protein